MYLWNNSKVIFLENSLTYISTIEARLTISKMTPMNDTLDICAKHVDSANAENLVRKLMDVIKSGGKNTT